MSAKGRKREKGALYVPPAHELYETPEWVTEAIVDKLKTDHYGRGAAMYENVLEPAAGKGAIIKVLRKARLPIQKTTAVELNPANLVHLRARVRPSRLVHGTFQSFASLTMRKEERFSLIITNPPFSLAETFVWRGLDLLRAETGFLVLLLRLAFLEGQGRDALHKKHPSDVHVLPRRPSFTRDGNSDMAAYAWFVWGPGCGGRWSRL